MTCQNSSDLLRPRLHMTSERSVSNFCSNGPRFKPQYDQADPLPSTAHMRNMIKHLVDTLIQSDLHLSLNVNVSLEVVFLRIGLFVHNFLQMLDYIWAIWKPPSQHLDFFVMLPKSLLNRFYSVAGCIILHNPAARATIRECRCHDECT